MILLNDEAILSAHVGTKAKNLGLLCRLSQGRGWMVPSGGAFTVEDCAALLQDPECEKRMLRELEAADLDSGVAVRSSARVEDLYGRSAAGQYETVLDVSGAAELSAALKAVVRSYSESAARSYVRATAGDAEPAQDDGGLIVQRMVPAAKSGAMFARSSEVVIEAVWGLGAALMAGEVTPAHYAVDTESESVICKLAPKPGGAVLEPDELLDIYEAGNGLREHFGRGQEIEWAIDEAGRLYLLQVRPLPGSTEG